MCGIAGIVYADTAKTPPSAVLHEMANAIAHRGPDAEGVWTRAGVGLAHRRLSVIDVTGGDQPIANEDGSIQVVFNGEIYNYEGLRDDLVLRGHQFRTKSDTEVLVHLYEELGAGLVERLRGMFAFAIWDSKRRHLLLARDRIGLKPLYYYRDKEKFLFGSEAKAILAFPGFSRDLSIEGLEDYLTFGFVSGERSLFRGILKLRPGHTLTVGPDGSVLPPQCYWRFCTESKETHSVGEWVECLDAKINETVRAHKVADVPVGAFLSGGIDSSAVVAVASGGQSLKTFSIGFQEEQFSELPYARLVAQQFGTDHYEEVITADAIQTLDELVHYFDEPFADASAIPSLVLSRLARKHVKVVLSGDGGDEAFGGYSRYVHDLREASIRGMLPLWFQSCVLRKLAIAWPQIDWLPRAFRAKTTLANLSLQPHEAYANTLAVCRPELRKRLMLPDVRRDLGGYVPEDGVRNLFGQHDSDPLRGMIAADVGLLLPDDFLTKVDRTSMSVGLEVRPPFVDHELLEFAMKIPSKWKVYRGESKWILKQLFHRRLPRGILARRKQGFEIPLSQWLRGPLRGLCAEAVLSPASRLTAYFDHRALQRLYRDHQSGRRRNGQILWSMLVLDCWIKRYLTPATSSRLPSHSL